MNKVLLALFLIATGGALFTALFGLLAWFGSSFFAAYASMLVGIGTFTLLAELLPLVFILALATLVVNKLTED